MPNETGYGEDGQARRHKRPSPLWLAAGAGVLALGFGAMAMAGKKANTDVAAEVQDTTPLVEVARVEAAEPTYTVRAPGRLKPRQELTVVGEVSGKVVYVHPDLILGGRIDENEVILRIDPGDYTAELARAEANLATANARLEAATAERDRQVKLAEIGAAPERLKENAVAAYEDAKAAVKQAEAAVTIAQRSVSKSAIRAPFPAIVVSEDVSLGGYVAPSVPLARLIDARGAELVAGLAPEDVQAVRAAYEEAGEQGLTVTAVPNSGSVSTGTLTGRIEQFSPVIDPAARTVSVVATFPDAFAPEMDGQVFADDFMTLEIEAHAPREVWRVPESAMRQDSWVWVVDGHDTLRKRAVTRIDRQGNFVLVTSPDLEAGERILTTLLAEEIEGQKVRVAETRQEAQK